jgi:hypothetical protein
MSQWLWIMVCYSLHMCELWWGMLSQRLTIVVYYNAPVVVNHDVLCWASGCESLWIMLSQWLCNIVSYNVILVVWEPWCVILSQWLGITVWMPCQWVWIMVSYAEPVVVNHYVLFCASRCEPWRVMMKQWLWIMLCYYVAVCVTHDDFSSTSGCVSWCVILCQ